VTSGMERELSATNDRHAPADTGPIPVRYGK
jgi:hypothetical protein